MSADKKILDVLVATSTTGNNWKQGIMLQKALTERGYDSELVHTANCHKNKNILLTQTDQHFILLQVHHGLVMYFVRNALLLRK